MKKTNLLKSMLLLCALIVGSMNSWATDVLYYTLDGTKTGSGSGYATANPITQNDMNWKVTGNTQMNPWRIGGNSIENVDRPVYSETAMGAAISKIELIVGTAADITVNSVTLIVASNSSFTTDKQEIDVPFTASSTLTIYPTLPATEWAKDSYYKFVFNVTKSGSGNKFVEFKAAKFYTKSFTITAESNNDSYGTVELEGFTITANPESGYRVISGDGGYTISDGTATVTNNGDNTFTVEPSTDCTITINFEAIPSHTATFSVNGIENSTTYLEGADIVFPSNPSSLGGKVFKGWIKTPIDGTTDTEPAEYFTSGVMSTGDVSYYAVFATESTGEGNITKTITIETDNFPTTYGTAKTFTEYTLEGVKFKIQQAYINNSKLQWRSGTDTSNGAGTMYNTDALSKIQSIVLTYNGDTNKNFTVKVGDSENPTSGTSIDPSASGDVYTFDCSSYNKSYFVLTNGDKAGYLASIAITYRGTTTIYTGYCTTVPPAEPSDPVVSSSTVTLSTTANMDGWRSYDNNTSKKYTVGENTKVYYAKAATTSSISLKEIEGGVPANTAVILHKTDAGGAAANIVLTETLTDITAPDDNILQVTAGTEALPTSGHKAYRLGYKSGAGNGVGFYKYTTTSAPAGIIYVEADESSPANFLSLDFGEGESDVTSISEIEKKRNAENEAFFNLAGQRVAQPTKGLYIVNGKKVVLK